MRKGCMCLDTLWKSKDTLVNSVLSLHHVGPRYWTQVFSLGARCLCQLSHLLTFHIHFWRFIYFYVRECLLTCVYVPYCAWFPQWAINSIGSPGVTGGCDLFLWVLATEPRLSARTVSALKHWVISPAPEQNRLKGSPNPRTLPRPFSVFRNLFSHSKIIQKKTSECCLSHSRDRKALCAKCNWSGVYIPQGLVLPLTFWFKVGVFKAEPLLRCWDWLLFLPYFT